MKKAIGFVVLAVVCGTVMAQMTICDPNGCKKIEPQTPDLSWMNPYPRNQLNCEQQGQWAGIIANFKQKGMHEPDLRQAVATSKAVPNAKITMQRIIKDVYHDPQIVNNLDDAELLVWDRCDRKEYPFPNPLK